MIFTRRFGALAARPDFPSVTEIETEQEIELVFGNVDDPRRMDETAA